MLEFIEQLRMNDRHPYTYRITCISTNQHYYGVRYAKGCKPTDLWQVYFTSSEYVKELIKIHGKENFTIEIRKIFDNVDVARRWEKRVNDYTKNWPNYLNKFSGTSPSLETALKSVASRRISKKGIHGLSKDELSTNAKKSFHLGVGIHSQTQEERLALSSKAGKTAKTLGKGIHSHTREMKISNGSLGGSATKGLLHWTNGEKDTKSATCPGPEWHRGRTFGKRGVTNKENI